MSTGLETAATKRRLTAEEYLARERTADEKSELLDGELIPWSSYSVWHSLIAANLMSAIHALTAADSCRVFNSSLKIRCAERTYLYPDGSVSCESLTVTGGEQHFIDNPIVICEVLSPSTEAYDRGRKFEQYRRISSLKEYALISQDRCVVEHYSKQADDSLWLMRAVVSPNASVSFPCLGISIPLSRIYAKVEFPPMTPDA